MKMLMTQNRLQSNWRLTDCKAIGGLFSYEQQMAHLRFHNITKEEIITNRSKVSNHLFAWKPVAWNTLEKI